jgi:hypothetical protein
MRLPLILVTAVLGLSGCAALTQINSEVSSYGQWPAARAPGTYAFERLPSQESRPEQQQLLEDAARPALERAGFKAASDPKKADVTVQLGARISPNERSPFDDPFWWNGGLYANYSRLGRIYWRTGMHFPPTPSYAREVALLIRDRESGQPLFESRAVNDGASPSMESLLPAMYSAAMLDFPSGGINPRTVTTDLKPK